MSTPIRWPLEAIWQDVEPSLPGFTCEVLPTVDSTNTELMRRFKAGQPEPILLVAEQQSAGRGRLGRHWHGQRGDSLMFSVGLLLEPTDWSGLSLAVGISLAESLDAVHPTPARIGLKWPNDLWLTGAQTGHKLAGVLVETASMDGRRYVVIGVGINICPVKLTGHGANPIPPGCLQDVLPGTDAAQALRLVVAPLVQAVQAFAQFGFAPFQARFSARDVLAGRVVQLSDGVQGKAHGVTEAGALLVHTSTGMKEITSAEVSVRPVGSRAPTEGLRPC